MRTGYSFFKAMKYQKKHPKANHTLTKPQKTYVQLYTQNVYAKPTPSLTLHVHKQVVERSRLPLLTKPQKPIHTNKQPITKPARSSKTQKHHYYYKQKTSLTFTIIEPFNETSSNLFKRKGF
jgi:hypothetical protein